MGKKFILTEDEMQKIAELIVCSSNLIRQTGSIGRNLLEDNAELQEKVASLELKQRKEQRQKTINKIAGIMQDKGLVAKTKIPEKIAELEKMADDTLSQLENTFDGLNGTPAEKQAAEEGFTTLEFMQSIDVDNSKLHDGKPRPMTFQ
jgi:hypothetical protein